MRTAISTLVATAVALHSVLGCCWHHAHETEASDPTALLTAERDEHEHEVAPQKSAHHCGCPHHHVADLAGDLPAAPAEDSPYGDSKQSDSKHGDSDHPEPCRGPCADKCIVVAAPRVQLENDGSAVFPAAVLFVRQSTIELNTSLAEFTAHDAANYPPPERIHLLYQLLLI